MKKKSFLSIALILIVNCLSVNGMTDKSTNIKNLNVPFVVNQGQFGNGILFGVNTFGGNVYLSVNYELIYALRNQRTSKMVVFKERFLPCQSSDIKGEIPTATKVNYFLGSKRTEWKTVVPTFENVNLGEIYPGITAKLRAHGGNIEKIFYVQPEADVNAIYLSFDGITSTERGSTGEIVLHTSNGEVSFTKPAAYQITQDGSKKNVEIEYVIKENGYGFKVGDYDKSRELLIDPLLASTFIGSNSYDDDYGPSLQIDHDGFVYLCGYTNSSSFPYTGGIDPSYNGGKDIFIAKFNNDLSTLLASTFFGGSGDEYEATMAFDMQKQNLYIGGYTSSADFPCTVGAYDTTLNGGTDAYIFKIDKNLSVLHASGYLGGSANEGQQWPKLDIAVSESGNACITGLTCSEDFPVLTGLSHDSTYSGGSIGGDAFVAVFNGNLTGLLASTYIGGSANEWRMSIALDADENIFVCGETESGDFEFTSNAYNPGFNGGSDIFICKFNDNLSELLTATSFGKSNYEEPLDIKIDTNNNVFIAGYTKSTNFTTTAGVFDNTFSGGNRDGYVAKFNNNLSELLASTFIGGNSRDDCTSLIIDGSGDVYVAGNTISTNFPHTQASYDSVFHGGSEYGDAFISVLDNDLTQLKASTYLGGIIDDRALDIALDDGNIIIAGYSKSNDFPYTRFAYDTLNTGSSGDCFISKFTPDLTGIIVDIEPVNMNFNNHDCNLNTYPNPFTIETTVHFVLKSTSYVKLIVCNMSGKIMDTIIDKKLSQGSYAVKYYAEDLISGTYFCKLITAEKECFSKIIRVK